LTSEEIKAAGAGLAQLDEARMIARAVGAPLDGWGFSIEERIAMANHLSRRRQELLVAVA
jgi:hypothetical protein